MQLPNKGSLQFSIVHTMSKSSHGHQDIGLSNTIYTQIVFEQVRIQDGGKSDWNTNLKSLDA